MRSQTPTLARRHKSSTTTKQWIFFFFFFFDTKMPLVVHMHTLKVVFIMHIAEVAVCPK